MTEYFCPCGLKLLDFLGQIHIKGLEYFSDIEYCPFCGKCLAPKQPK